jgi:DNA polymerase-3 subunit gamma/tau
LQSVASSNRPILNEQAQKWGLPTILAALQILAETKTRMQRSGMGRALAELALVRLCLLEETLDLASLVEELRSGQAEPESKGPAGPGASRAPSHARSLRTASTTASKPEVAQSKPGPSLSPPVEPVSSVGSDPATPAATFERGHADAIWAQIASRIDVKDFLGTAIAKVSRTAISGPNQLEIFFPAAYHSNKTHCEQPATLGRLEKVASEVAGKPVRVVCQLEAPDPPAEPAAGGVGPESPIARTPAGNAQNGRQDPASVSDPYVERARTIFGATIENVTVANRSAREASDESDSARES